MPTPEEKMAEDLSDEEQSDDLHEEESEEEDDDTEDDRVGEDEEIEDEESEEGAEDDKEKDKKKSDEDAEDDKIGEYSHEALLELSRIAALKGSEQQPVKEKLEKVEDKEEKAPEVGKEVNFFDGLIKDGDELTAESVNKALNKAFNLGIQSQINMGNNVLSLTRSLITTQSMVERFYQNNPDLDKYRPLVQQVSSEVLEANPDLAKDNVKLLAETAKQFRKKYGLPVPQKGQKPRNKISKPTGGSRPVDKKGSVRKTNMQDDLSFTVDDDNLI